MLVAKLWDKCTLWCHSCIKCGFLFDFLMFKPVKFPPAPLAQSPPLEFLHNIITLRSKYWQHLSWALKCSNSQTEKQKNKQTQNDVQVLHFDWPATEIKHWGWYFEFWNIRSDALNFWWWKISAHARLSPWQGFASFENVLTTEVNRRDHLDKQVRFGVRESVCRCVFRKRVLAVCFD